MKKIILLIVSVWMCVSCGNLEEMNIDPDNATQTHPKLLLTHLLYIAEIVIVAKTSAGPFVILICTLSVGLNYFFGSIHSVSPSFKSIHADLATMTISAMYKRWVKRQNV